LSKIYDSENKLSEFLFINNNYKCAINDLHVFTKAILSKSQIQMTFDTFLNNLNERFDSTILLFHNDSELCKLIIPLLTTNIKLKELIIELYENVCLTKFNENLSFSKFYSDIKKEEIPIYNVQFNSYKKMINSVVLEPLSIIKSMDINLSLSPAFLFNPTGNRGGKVSINKKRISQNKKTYIKINNNKKSRTKSQK
jgi:hypothetical protein